MLTDPTSKPPSRRQVLGWGAGALAAAGLAACSSKAGSSATVGSSRTIKITHATGAPAVFNAVSFLAEDLGYYKAEGLRVQRTFLGGGPPAAAALAAGSSTQNLSSPGELLGLVAKGQKLQVLMAHTNVEPLVFLLSKKAAEAIGVTATSDLATRQSALAKVKNGRYGVTAVGSETYGVTRLALKHAGVNPSNVQLVPLQSGANLLAALTNDRIDGFFFVPPTTNQAVLQAGAVPLLFDAAGDVPGGRGLQGQCVEVRESDVKSNPDLYASLIRAEIKALRYVVEHSDAARDVLRKTRFSSIPEGIWQSSWADTKSCWGSPYIRPENLQGWVTSGLVAGAQPTDPFPYDQVIDMSFVEDAVKAIGWTPPTADN